jgi:hypothetical protein
MKIVTQDRDYIYKHKGDLVTSANWTHEGVYMGVNLYDGDNFLGTIDTPQEALDEITAILKYEHEVYVVSGFSDYDEV